MMQTYEITTLEYKAVYTTQQIQANNPDHALEVANQQIESDKIITNIKLIESQDDRQSPTR